MNPAIQIKRFLNWRAWLRGLFSSVIKGGSGAVLASTGLLGANLVGVDVKPLEYGQMGGVFFGAAFLQLMIYVNAHPLPEEIQNDTETSP